MHSVKKSLLFKAYICIFKIYQEILNFNFKKIKKEDPENQKWSAVSQSSER